jgi:hypothetical protein
MPYPYGEARARFEWGRMLAQDGGAEQARHLLDEALAIFQRLGAQPYIAWAERLLRPLGGN